MIIPDASIILEVLLRTSTVARIQDRLFDRRETLYAPHLLDLEVAQVLRRYTLRLEISPEDGFAALDLLVKFPVVRHGHEPLLQRIWALRANDAAYVTLAEDLRVTQLTRVELI